jgi:hypothetical protein
MKFDKVKIVGTPLHEPGPPVFEPGAELHGWKMLSTGKIYAEYVKNHPRLGSGPNCFTSLIIYINRELRIASSRNTTYKLFDEKPND